ncbi:MAG: hypothetical protein AB8E15_09545, partial [Bdellovibrionales bacterium]
LDENKKLDGKLYFKNYEYTANTKPYSRCWDNYTVRFYSEYYDCRPWLNSEDEVEIDPSEVPSEYDVLAEIEDLDPIAAGLGSILD